MKQKADALSSLATQYWQEVEDAADVTRVVNAGTRLLEEAPTFEAGMEQLRKSWCEQNSNHLQGVFADKFDETLPEDLLWYLREVAKEGVDLRYKGPRRQVSAAPHASAAKHQDSAWRDAWNDLREGRLCLARADSFGVSRVVPSPQGAVEKFNPDRTCSGDFRFINDMRLPNAACEKEDHPPARQPQHHQLAREICWWSQRCPGLRILMAKKDVKSAFKLVWVNPEGSAIMAIELVGSLWGLACNILAISLVLVFGW
eukprot:3146131-Amphidinium_carterae.1